MQVGCEHRAVRARAAGPEERARLWALAVFVYRGFAGYQCRTDREIPLFVLERR